VQFFNARTIIYSKIEKNDTGEIKFFSRCLDVFFYQAFSYALTQSVWLPSPYFRAGNNKVISTMTGTGGNSMYTFTFSSALSGVPNLAYGIKNYRGKPAT